MDFLAFLGQMFVALVFIVSIPAVIYLLFKINKTSQVIEQVVSKQYTLLRILVPKQNEKMPQAAEEMFASIHGIFRPDQTTQDHLSFEIAARDQYIQFFCYVSKDMKDYVEGQIYAQYPTVEISEVQDYTDIDLRQWSVAAAELTLTKPDFYPIKTFNNFQVDPLAGITSVLSKIEDGEQIWIQMLMRPIADTWQEKTLAYVKMIESGDKPKEPDKVTIGKILKGTAGFVTDVAQMAATGKFPEKAEVKKEKPSLPGPVIEGLRAAEGKTTKLGFEVIIRVCAIARDDSKAAAKINGVLGAFKQYSINNLNGFALSKISTEKERILPVFQTRAFPTAGYILNVEELASIYHLPSQSVETPSIVWAGAKKGEPPANLPIEGMVAPSDVTLFGKTNYRHFNHRFGIKIPDRRYHMYAIGKTGTGKSTMLRNMIIDDIQKGRGVCVVDPHGDLISHVLDYIPDNRIDDVVYFNPSDREHPIGFNLLESVDPDLKNIVASGLMSIFTKLWANVWSARMEYILRNTVLALLEYPNATLLEIMKVLVDPVFRRKVMYHVKDPVIRDFFLNEYEKYDPKFRTEAIAPIQNKVGQFLSSSTIRNIMGQIKSTINVRDIMDTGKIFLVDLSVGKIGEDNAALLGSMIITKIQLAAMGRADTPEDDRRDFYLYVDEFQNFATDSFAVILSEARKYHLNLIITHQYIAQMPEVVSTAVFGNVGTIVAFRIGAADAGALQKEFEPVFDANDLVNLDNYHVYLKMAIDARTAVPFSAVTLPPFSGKNGNRETAISESIRKYTVNRESIEKEITERNEANSGTIGTLSEVDGELVYKEELKPYEPMNPLPKNAVMNGIDLWKVRDKEGKPFYVIGEDYDEYMFAKDKESDRPGAAAKPASPVASEEKNDSNDKGEGSGGAPSTEPRSAVKPAEPKAEVKAESKPVSQDAKPVRKPEQSAQAKTARPELVKDSQTHSSASHKPDNRHNNVRHNKDEHRGEKAVHDQQGNRSASSPKNEVKTHRPFEKLLAEMNQGGEVKPVAQSRSNETQPATKPEQQSSIVRHEKVNDLPEVVAQNPTILPAVSLPQQEDLPTVTDPLIVTLAEAPDRHEVAVSHVARNLTEDSHQSSAVASKSVSVPTDVLADTAPIAMSVTQATVNTKSLQDADNQTLKQREERLAEKYNDLDDTDDDIIPLMEL